MYGLQQQTGAAFRGVLKSSFEQKLADGNVIRNVTRSREARDGLGRTMTEMSQGCAEGADGQLHERFSVNVVDTVARTTMSWTVGDDQQPKVVRVFHMPEPPPHADVEACKVLSPEEQAAQEKLMKAAMAQQAQQTGYKTEDLGFRNFHGVPARGTRNTRTIPAEQEGNERPLVVTNEMWQSPEMGLTMMMISEDPRRGTTTTEFEEFSVGEPEPKLFAAPEGYKMEEEHPQPQIVVPTK